MNTYKVLNKQIFTSGRYSLAPIRFENRYDIMKWRNEQMYHLRQSKLLTKEDQDAYFENVVAKLFQQEQPNQLLFSFLEDDICIGYGGLVHINWSDENAEISFIMNTELEKEFFSFLWQFFLKLIEKVAFEELLLHKIFTYAYDLRPKLYEVIESLGYYREARLKEHCLFQGKFIDVVIHSKTNNMLYLRDASKEDLDVTYSWANHPNVRQYAFNQGFIPLAEHTKWYFEKLSNENCIYKILVCGDEPIGSIRFDIKGEESLISYLIAPNQTGKGLGKKLLELSVLSLEKERPDILFIKGLVKTDNIASVKIFKKLGFDCAVLDESLLEFRIKLEHAIR